MGLVEATTALPGNLGPNTHNRGQTPINRIFIPQSLLNSIMAGYYAFGEGIPSDHQALWLDIPLTSLGWFNIPAPIPLKAQRLKCTDPRIVKQYNMALQELMEQHHLAP